MDAELRAKLALWGLIVVGLLSFGLPIFYRNVKNVEEFTKVQIAESDSALRTPKDFIATESAELRDMSSQAARSGTSVVVHVAGAVQNPGVYALNPGERVIDALKRAGGSKPGADLDAVNLAAHPQDGDQIYIPRKAEQPLLATGESASLRDASQGRYSSKASLTPRTSGIHRISPARTPAGIGRININTANVSQLDTLPGIGPATAQNIIQYRKAAGGFARSEDLMNVKGIGEKKYADIKKFIVVR